MNILTNIGYNPNRDVRNGRRTYQLDDLNAILTLNDAISAKTDDQISQRGRKSTIGSVHNRLGLSADVIGKTSSNKALADIGSLEESFLINNKTQSTNGSTVINWFRSSCIALDKALASGSHARTLYVIAKCLKDGYVCYTESESDGMSDEEALLLRSFLDRVPTEYSSTKAIQNCIAWTVDLLQLAGFDISSQEILTDAQSLQGPKLMIDLIMKSSPDEAIIAYQVQCPNYPQLVMAYTSPSAELRLWQ